jgi:hypothetical protein
MCLERRFTLMIRDGEKLFVVTAENEGLNAFHPNFTELVSAKNSTQAAVRALGIHGMGQAKEGKTKLHVYPVGEDCETKMVPKVPYESCW